MRVEIDVFSGLPNPTWKLAAADAEDISSSLKSLSRADTRVSIPALGFRGFLLHRDGESIRVYRGHVIVDASGSETGAETTYRDTAGIEATLADDARARGFSHLVPARER